MAARRLATPLGSLPWLSGCRVIGAVFVASGLYHVTERAPLLASMLGGWLGVLGGIEMALGMALLYRPNREFRLALALSFLVVGAIWRAQVGEACQCLPPYLRWLEVGGGWPLRLGMISVLVVSICFCAGCRAWRSVVACSVIGCVALAEFVSVDSCVVVSAVRRGSGMELEIENGCRVGVTDIEFVPGCDCLDYSLSHAELAPGELSVVRVRYRSPEAAGTGNLISWKMNGVQESVVLR